MIFFIFLILNFSLFAEIVDKRGFIVEDPQGRIFLVDTPNIRSCCVAKKGEAIELLGDFSSYSRWGAVTVRGRLIETSDGLKLVADGFALSDLLSEKISSD